MDFAKKSKYYDTFRQGFKDEFRNKKLGSYFNAEITLMY